MATGSGTAITIGAGRAGSRAVTVTFAPDASPLRVRIRVGIELVAGIRCWIAASLASCAGSSSLCFFNSEIRDSS